MSSNDPRDLHLEPQRADPRTDPSEPVPVLRPAETAPSSSRPSGPSPVAKRLAVLLRCHEAAATHGVWLWIWWGIRGLVVVGVAIPLCIGIGNAVDFLAYHYLADYQAKYGGDKTDYRMGVESSIAGWAAGVGTGLLIALLWAVFEWLWPKRYRPLEEQIAALQRDHAAEVRAWGGPAVLREPAAVAELYRLETGR